jgi:hypothetical protein
MSDFDLEAVRTAVRGGRLRWRQHALERMLERHLSTHAVKEVILNGELIEEYATTLPYPSGLLLGVAGDRPIHVLVGWDAWGSGVAYTITAYEPDDKHFEADLKTRKRRAHD